VVASCVREDVILDNIARNPRNPAISLGFVLLRCVSLILRSSLRKKLLYTRALDEFDTIIPVLLLYTTFAPMRACETSKDARASVIAVVLWTIFAFVDDTSTQIALAKLCSGCCAISAYLS